jgi:hypothetical protein
MVEDDPELDDPEQEQREERQDHGELGERLALLSSSPVPVR